jgi:ferredoxin
MADSEYSVTAAKCLRCGACSTLAPGIIAMEAAAAAFLRQPSTPSEITAVEAALFNCPVGAIQRRAKA